MSLPYDDPQRQPNPPNHGPDPRAWLENVQIKKLSTVENWFYKNLHNGANTPPAVCADVSQTVQRRLEWASPPETQQFLQDVLEALHRDPAGALAYAQDVIVYEALPYAERQQVKAERSFRYFKTRMEGQPTTERQTWRIRHEGYTGDIPNDRAEASALIQRLLQQKGGHA